MVRMRSPVQSRASAPTTVLPIGETRPLLMGYSTYMSGVEFNEPQLARAQPLVPKSSLLVRSVMSLGLAKDAKGAQTVLLFVALLLLAVMGFVFMTGVFGSGQAPADEAEVLRG